MSNIVDDDGHKLLKEQKTNNKEANLEDSDDDIMIDKRGIEREDDSQYKVPERLNICQVIMIAILYVLFALLVSFLIYISVTWNKDRTNEYT